MAESSQDNIGHHIADIKINDSGRKSCIKINAEIKRTIAMDDNYEDLKQN